MRPVTRFGSLDIVASHPRINFSLKPRDKNRSIYEDGQKIGESDVVVSTDPLPDLQTRLVEITRTALAACQENLSKWIRDTMGQDPPLKVDVFRDVSENRVIVYSTVEITPPHSGRFGCSET